MTDDQRLFCRHFVADADGDEVGHCRRYPPQIMTESDELVSVFPLVEESAWCGEFARRVM